MPETLTVTVSEANLSNYKPTGRHSWPVRIEAEATGDFDAAIFKYHAAPTAQPNAGDVCEGVCGLVDYIELPVDEAASAELPYYRTDTAEFIFRSALEANKALENIWKAIGELVDNWNASRNLVEEEVREFTVEV